MKGGLKILESKKMLQISRILVPVDWSEPSNQAFQIGVSLARHNAQLVLVHVVPPPLIMYGPPPEAYMAQLREELCRIKPSDPKISVRHLLAEGEPAAEIIRITNEARCDLIVMGTHERTGLNRVLMGSVAEKVVRKAPCLVLTVNSQMHTREQLPDERTGES